MNTPYKRRNYFIKKELQGKYVLIYFAMVVIGTVLFALLFSLISANTLSISYDNYNLQVGTTPKILVHKFLAAEWLFILLGGLTVVIVAIFLSHRVAGPLYKLERSVNGMISGNFASTIYLRRKDEGQELAEKLNQLNEMLSAKIQEMRHLNKRMDQHLLELSGRAASQEGVDKTRIVLQEMGQVNTQLRDVLYDFSIREH